MRVRASASKGEIMGAKLLGALLSAAVLLVLGAGLAQADTVDVSAGCIAGPGSPTCFRPNLHIGSDPTANLIPLFVEVTVAAGAHAAAGAEAVISMQADLEGSEFISLVLMNLDPLVDPAHVTITFHASSDAGLNAPVINDGTDSQGGEGFFGFDISWDYPNAPPSGRFDNSDLVTFLVDCTGSSCTNFNASSFDFTELSDQGNSGEGAFRICARVQGVGTSGEGSDKVCGTPGTGVAEPGTLTLLGAALVGLGFVGRKRLLAKKK